MQHPSPLGARLVALVQRTSRAVVPGKRPRDLAICECRQAVGEVRRLAAAAGLNRPRIKKYAYFRTTGFFNRCETRSATVRNSPATVHNSPQQPPTAPNSPETARNSPQQFATVPKRPRNSPQQSRNSPQQLATVPQQLATSGNSPQQPRNSPQQPETAPPPRNILLSGSLFNRRPGLRTYHVRCFRYCLA